jgi:hypothetical protein
MDTKILMRATKRPPAAEPDLTARDIAERVRKKNALQLAEGEIRAARLRRDELDSEIRSLNAKRGSGDPRLNNGNLVQDIVSLSDERAEISKKLDGLKVRVRPLREEHAAAVVDALTPMRQAAADRLIAAAAEVAAATQTLDDCAAQIVRYGGDALPVRVPDFSAALQLARRLVGGAR